MLCFDYFVVNLFPVSTFDMGLVVAGASPQNYLGIIKADSSIKLILMLVFILNLINMVYLKACNIFAVLTETGGKVGE